MKKAFIIPIILFINVVFVVYFLLPNYFNYSSLKKEISQLKEEVQKRENETLNAQQIADKLNNYKEAVDKMGGEISVTSEIGQGAEFELVIPNKI